MRKDMPEFSVKILWSGLFLFFAFTIVHNPTPYIEVLTLKGILNTRFLSYTKYCDKHGVLSVYNHNRTCYYSIINYKREIVNICSLISRKIRCFLTYFMLW